MYALLAGIALTVIPPIPPDVPNRQPQMAVSGKTVALVFGSGKSVMFARSDDGGVTMSKPAAIAEIPVLPLSRHRGPRVVFSGKTILVTAIGGTEVATGPHAHGLPSDGNLLAWRSTDGGKSWSKSVAVNDVPGAAREGLHALAADAEGNVAAVWLDLRTKGTRLFGATSKDGGATWSANFKVYESPDGTICQCCHPSLAALGKGEFAVMFRNVLAGCRDMYVSRITGSKVTAEPQKAGSGTWTINACPMDGGGIAQSNGKIVTAWRRDQDVFLASANGGETRLGPGKDVALAANGGSVYAVWNHAGVIKAHAAGREEELAREGAFPSVAALPGSGALAAWEEKGAIALKRLP